MSTALNKSLYVAGVQCHKLLWWKVHEPLAPELQPDKVLLDRFDQGRQVGELARNKFPGGVLIDAKGASVEARVAATRDAMESGAPAVFEATFVADGVTVKVDVLQRMADRQWRLIEAKMTSSAKEEHVPDVAVQLHVAQQCGVDVGAVAVMHLNPEFRQPDQGELLMATDMTTPARAMLPSVPAIIESLRTALTGPLPATPIGHHCGEPRSCPFLGRCWPKNPDHIGKLYLYGIKRASDAMAKGIQSVWDIPPKQKINDTARRQLRSLREDRMIVEPGLADALAPFAVPRLGFLDFETIVRAVPVWPGMKPHEPGPAQFSYHEADPSAQGGYRHAEFLAEGPQDARPELARRMLEATRGATRVVTYSGYEKGRIRGLQESVPALRDELKALEEKLIDLLPVVRDNVYHPTFDGSFSIKAVLNPLVPDLRYSDLIIVDGLTASVEIARLLFVSGRIKPEEHARVRQDLLNYCERDTWAMVRLLDACVRLQA